MLVPYRHPSEKADASAFNHAWLRRAWGRTIGFERTRGIILSLSLGALVAILDAVLEHDVNLGAILLSVAGAAALVLFVTYAVSLWSVPSRLAWGAEHVDEEGESDFYYGVGIGVGPKDPPRLTFVTRNDPSRAIDIHMARPVGPVTALRFVEPMDVTIRASQLPARVRIPHRRGYIVVKAMNERYVVIGDVRTTGVMFVAELYFKDGYPMYGEDG